MYYKLVNEIGYGRKNYTVNAYAHKALKIGKL